MTTSNQELMKKADWAVADLAANGGLLSPEQSTTFIRKLLVQPTLLRQARVVTMGAPTRQINKIQFATRILQAGTSGVALTLAQRSKPTTEKIELNTKEVVAEINIPYDVIEDNIERGNVGLEMDGNQGTPVSGGIKDTIMTLIAERAALDLEELAILGDTTSGDPYLAQFDGFLKLATANIVDVAGAPITKAVFKDGIKAMPDQYLRNRAAMRHYVSVDQETEYRDTLANRETAVGDNIIQGLNPVYGFGVPVEPVSLMPAAQGLFTFPQNFIFGIQRQIMVETAKDIRARTWIIVLTARIDVLIEENQAVVKYINIG